MGLTRLANQITFVFILILFIDSVNRVYSVTNELSRSSGRDGTHAVLGHERMEVQARKFYSQRNMLVVSTFLQGAQNAD